MTEEIEEGYIPWQILGYEEEVWGVEGVQETQIVAYSKLYVEDSEKGRLTVSTMGCRRAEEEGAVEFWILDDDNDVHAVYRPGEGGWEMVWPNP